EEIEKAIAIFNALPPMSQLSPDLREFPLDESQYMRRINHRASALGLLDLKTVALGMVLEQVGLAAAERYVYTLRSRVVLNNIPYYTTIKGNFDPVDLTPSSYVNGTLYSFAIYQTYAQPDTWESVEFPVDPTGPRYTSLSVFANLNGGTVTDNSGFFIFPLTSGLFFNGLTRDDVGGLRYLYRPSNYNVENGPTNATGSAGGAWGIPGSTNSFISQALRPGLDKVTLRRADYDALLGTFIAFTNRYSETVITNNRTILQSVERAVVVPDILFSAGDLGVDAVGIPFFALRTGAPTWVNNDAINGNFALNGPGVIPGGVNLQFSKVLPAFYNIAGGDETTAFFLGAWGSFDGTTNAPIVYPIGTSIEAMESLLFEAENQAARQPWDIPR
ncbi:MAG: hypothetical protein HYZ36_04430, partial [Pedosphaera parvula]|nr:hypothetical protein [Pedosphaera parvula]